MWFPIYFKDEEHGSKYLCYEEIKELWKNQTGVCGKYHIILKEMVTQIQACLQVPIRFQSDTFNPPGRTQSHVQKTTLICCEAATVWSYTEVMNIRYNQIPIQTHRHELSIQHATTTFD